MLLISQDAHICSLDFDKNSSLFAVFDGHGGAEVAMYCSQKLPEFLKSTASYTKKDFEQALKDTFIGFDATLVDESVIEQLRKLMPAERHETDTDEDGEEDEDEDLAELCQESRMPLSELLEKYKEGKLNPLAQLKRSEAAGSKPISPYLRGRRNGEGSGSSGVPAEEGGSASADGVGSSAVQPRKIDVDVTGEEAVSSSSASAKAGLPSNEASSSSITAGGSGSSSSSSNGPSSSSKLELDKNNCNSPDSSSTTKRDEAQAEAAGSTTAESSDVKTDTTKQVANGAASSGENEISTNSVKTENVSSSSAEGGSAIENGVASSNSGSGDKISSTKSMPQLDAADDDSSSDGDDSYNENKSTSEDDDMDGAGGSDDESDEEDDELYPEDEEDDGFLNNMIEGPGSSSGCTAVVALLSGRDLYVANAGDSRCVVCRDGKALEMSYDHKPEDTEEMERITKAGGRVTLDGRVNGGLNLSRAIGDHAYKTNRDLKAEEQMISALPDIKKVTITDKDEFMILACDGIWNSMTSDEVVEFIQKRLQAGQTKLSTICEDVSINHSAILTNSISINNNCNFEFSSYSQNAWLRTPWAMAPVATIWPPSSYNSNRRYSNKSQPLLTTSFRPRPERDQPHHHRMMMMTASKNRINELRLIRRRQQQRHPVLKNRPPHEHILLHNVNRITFTKFISL